MSITEAVQKAQQYADKVSKKHEEFTWFPLSVKVCEDSSGHDAFVVYFAKSLYNSCFSYISPSHDSMHTPYTPMNFTNITINSKEEPAAIINPCGIQEIKNDTNVYDKIITYECAANLVSKLLSSFASYTVEYVALETRMVMTNKDYIEETNTSQDFDTGNTYETKPCWVFYLNTEPKQEQYVIVDCITGDTQYINNNK